MRRIRIRSAGAGSDDLMEGAIDIVFLLLIFFVMTSSFQVLVGAKINPPKKLDTELTIDNTKDIVMKISDLSEVVVVFRKQQYPLAADALMQDGTEKLRTFLAMSDEAKVVVFADYSSNFGVVNTLELMCTQLGITPFICYERGRT